MSVRRTLKQKQQAQLHRQETLRYSLSSATLKGQAPVNKSQPSPAPVSNHGPTLHEVFGYSPSLLWGDVLKTLLTTILVVGILLGVRYIPFFQV